jgi:hypothetical protein
MVDTPAPFRLSRSHISFGQFGHSIESQLSHLSLWQWFFAGLVIGAIAWSSIAPLIPLAAMLPMLWSCTTTRKQAFLLALGYHGGANWGLVLGIIRVLETGALPAICLWLVGSMLPAIVYAALRARSDRMLPVKFIAALLITAVPPVITGWANPMTMAGLILPGTAWAGLLATIVMLAWFARRGHIVWQGIALMLLCAVAYGHNGLRPSHEGKSHEGKVIAAYKSGFDYETGSMSGHEYERLQAAAAFVRSHPAQIYVFAEGYAGSWGDGPLAFWRNELGTLAPNATFVTGAHIDNSGGGYVNAAILFDRHHEARIAQRMPVPVSMWKPWSALSVPATFIGGSAVDTQQGRIAVANCYEIFMIWTMIDTMAERPQYLLGIGNAWWAKDTPIPALQEVILLAWGRLFGVESALAING